MAAIVLSTVGTAIGGPIGGAIGAMVGRQIDGSVFSAGTAERGRLKDLAVTTSSYGMPIPRHFGAVRTAGSIIWATDLKESKETSGGGKGKPKVTSYSYTISIAIALSSGPIDGIGRVWADGNLLRGEQGDLKVGGEMRLYRGFGDEEPDPLIAADRSTNPNSGCPGFRGLAYVVFEDLDLSSFGNRVPSLNFEIFAGDEVTVNAIIDSYVPGAAGHVPLNGVMGLSYEQGSLANLISGLNEYFPFAVGVDESGLKLTAYHDAADPVAITQTMMLASDQDGKFKGGMAKKRRSSDAHTSVALRYYDKDRDYQAGLQHALTYAGSGQGAADELPCTMRASEARAVIDAKARRERVRNDILQCHISELGVGLDFSRLVSVEGEAGFWTVRNWDLSDRGVELELMRTAISEIRKGPAEPGDLVFPQDLAMGETYLRAFELPADAEQSLNTPQVFAALSSPSIAWRGSALYRDDAGTLEPVASATRDQCVMGELASELRPSSALIYEADAALTVACLSPFAEFETRGPRGVENGVNKLLVGDEIIQFTTSEKVSDRLWVLGGLLRGRAGTESAALRGHPSGTAVTLLNQNLTRIENLSVYGTASPIIAAIGHGDKEPVLAELENLGATLRPLAPIHPYVHACESGELAFSWTRRARAEWVWNFSHETPLNEETESYRVGIGSVEAPILTWTTERSRFLLSAADRGNNIGRAVWVQQIGRKGASDPLFFPNVF